jgi:hypothetical protein
VWMELTGALIIMMMKLRILVSDTSSNSVLSCHTRVNFGGFILSIPAWASVLTSTTIFILSHYNNYRNNFCY